MTVKAFDPSGNASAASSALSVTTSSGSGASTIVLNPVQDAYVQAGSNANTNHGSETSLAIKNQGSTDDQTRQAYLRFNLGATSGRGIVSATLKLTVLQSKDNQTHTVHFVADDSWTESALTWNNKPAIGTTLATAAGSAGAGTVVSFDVTSQVAAEAAGDGAISLEIDANNNDFSSYHSKETATPALAPVLELVLSAAPPPSAPTGLAATNVTASSFNLSWTASTSSVGVASYEVFLNGVSVGTTAGTSLAIADLSASTTYAVTVVATDVDGSPSAPSAALSVVTSAASGGGTFSLNPVHDAYVQAGSYANTNYGLANSLAVKNQGATNDQTRQSYLRFDLSGLGAGTIVSATLKLTVMQSKDSQVHYLHFVSNDTWTESTIKWNNKPAVGALLASVSGSAAAGTVVAYDVTSQTATERAGDGLLSLEIDADNNDYSSYYSKDGNASTVVPVLEVVLAP